MEQVQLGGRQVAGFGLGVFAVTVATPPPQAAVANFTKGHRYQIVFTPTPGSAQYPTVNFVSDSSVIFQWFNMNPNQGSVTFQTTATTQIVTFTYLGPSIGMVMPKVGGSLAIFDLSTPVVGGVILPGAALTPVTPPSTSPLTATFTKGHGYRISFQPNSSADYVAVPSGILEPLGLVSGLSGLSFVTLPSGTTAMGQVTLGAQVASFVYTGSSFSRMIPVLPGGTLSVVDLGVGTHVTAPAPGGATGGGITSGAITGGAGGSNVGVPGPVTGGGGGQVTFTTGHRYRISYSFVPPNPAAAALNAASLLPAGLARVVNASAAPGNTSWTAFVDIIGPTTQLSLSSLALLGAVPTVHDMGLSPTRAPAPTSAPKGVSSGMVAAGIAAVVIIGSAIWWASKG